MALAAAATEFLPLVDDEEEPTEAGARPRMRVRMISVSVRFTDGRSKELRVKDTKQVRAALGALQRRR